MARAQIFTAWFFIVDTAGGQPFHAPNLTLLVHLASRDIALRMAVWISLVVAFGLFAGLPYMLTAATGKRPSPWTTVSGSDEVVPPPRPPGGPRAA